MRFGSSSAVSREKLPMNSDNCRSVPVGKKVQYAEDLDLIERFFEERSDLNRKLNVKLKSWEDYLSYMGRDKSWGGLPELKVLARMMSRRINVYQENSPPLRIEPADSAVGFSDLNLWWDGLSHFEARSESEMALEERLRMIDELNECLDGPDEEEEGSDEEVISRNFLLRLKRANERRRQLDPDFNSARTQSTNNAFLKLREDFVTRVNAVRSPNEQLDKYSDDGIEELVELAEKDTELHKQLKKHGFGCEVIRKSLKDLQNAYKRILKLGVECLGKHLVPFLDNLMQVGRSDMAEAINNERAKRLSINKLVPDE